MRWRSCRPTGEFKKAFDSSCEGSSSFAKSVKCPGSVGSAEPGVEVVPESGEDWLGDQGFQCLHE